MAVSYRAGAVANNGQTSSSANFPFTIPLSAVVGDTMLVILDQNQGSRVYTAPTPASGPAWVELLGPDTNGATYNMTTAIFVKDVVSGEPGTTVTFTSNGSSRGDGSMGVFTGTSAAQAFATGPAQVTTPGTTLTSPAITTTVANTMVVTLWALKAISSVSPTLSTPTGYTAGSGSTSATNYGSSPTTSGNYTTEVFYQTTPGAAGSYGGDSSTASAAAVSNVYSVGLPPLSSNGTLALSGSGSMASTPTSMTVAAPQSLSGSGALNLAGSPAMPGSMSLSGSDSGLSLAGSPRITGQLGTSGSTSLGLATPVGGVLSLTGASQLVMSSGTGQLYVFNGPVFYEYAPFQMFAHWSRLVFEIAYGETVWRDSTGTWHQQYAPTSDQLAGALAVYAGGRRYHLTDQQLADLTAGGYGGYITLENIP